MTRTGSMYDGMKSRLEKKGLPPLSFTKEMFRNYVLRSLGGHYDGALQCRYCRRWMTIQEIAADHEVPLSRGGSSDLFNIGFPCSDCNDRKGKLTPDEFLKLLDFLETVPHARIDVLKRLQQSTKLAAGARFNAARINELKQQGHWKRKTPYIPKGPDPYPYRNMKERLKDNLDNF